MKIVNIDVIREKIEKLDSMAQTDMTKPNTIFNSGEDKSVKSRMQRFFEVADGENPSWNV